MVTYSPQPKLCNPTGKRLNWRSIQSLGRASVSGSPILNMVESIGPLLWKCNLTLQENWQKIITNTGYFLFPPSTLAKE